MCFAIKESEIIRMGVGEDESGKCEWSRCSRQLKLANNSVENEEAVLR